MYAGSYVHTVRYVAMHAYTCKYACSYACVYAYTKVHMYIYITSYMHAYMYACVHAYIHHRYYIPYPGLETAPLPFDVLRAVSVVAYNTFSLKCLTSLE